MQVQVQFMTLFHTCCETIHRSGGRMKVNERRTVVGRGVDWPLCAPPTVERDQRAWCRVTTPHVMITQN